MKKIGSIVFTILFFLVLLIPLVTMPLGSSENAENRTLAEAPSLYDEEGRLNLSFTDDAAAYLDDRFGGKSLMVTAYSKILSGIFGQSSNAKVVLGTDGWMYFNETLGDYTGSSAFTDQELNRLCITMEQVRRRLEDAGVPFLFAVVPNKNTVYPAHMPYNYAAASQPSNLDRLAQRIPLLDMRDALSDQGEALYYQTDTHWNGRGARKGAQRIIEAIGEKTGVSPGWDWENGSSSPATVKGDLAKMLYPDNTPVESDVQYEDTAQEFEYGSRIKSAEDLTIETSGGREPLSVLMLRDSFTNALLPYISNSYDSVTYLREMPLPIGEALPEELDEEDAFLPYDIVVLEMVERRLNELLESAPSMLAK